MRTTQEQNEGLIAETAIEDVDSLGRAADSQARIRQALIAAAGLIALALVASFLGFQWRTEQLLREQLLSQARAFSSEVVSTRAFESQHGGVYVPESEDTTLNPYLAKVPEIKARIRDRDGSSYVLQDPALLTRRGEQTALREGEKVFFHLSSTKPLNPRNRASDREAEALGRIAGGADEAYWFATRDGRNYFQYVHPLWVTRSCLRCHATQGYKVGELRGGVIVSISADDVIYQITVGRVLTGVVLLASLAALMLALYLIMTRLFRSLLKAQKLLRDLATLDSLTGLFNRRMAMRRLGDEVQRADRAGEELSVVMFDLDNFKDVNDTRGHHVGDDVLKACAMAIASGARAYDVVARIGGEEFLALLPNTGGMEAVSVAERMRSAVAAGAGQVLRGTGTTVTVSAGVAEYVPGSKESADELLVRADRALYRAKGEGRDRVVVG